jgi:hypothetical protein
MQRHYHRIRGLARNVDDIIVAGDESCCVKHPPSIITSRLPILDVVFLFVRRFVYVMFFIIFPSPVIIALPVTSPPIATLRSPEAVTILPAAFRSSSKRAISSAKDWSPL